MATTLTTSTLAVSITENITINGVTYNKTETKNITDIKGYNTRIYSIANNASGFTTMATFSTAGTDADFDSDNVKYIRLLNLDDTASVIVTFSEASTAQAITLPALTSVVLFSPSIQGATSKAGISAIDPIETIFVRNESGAAVDMELVVATI